MAAWVNLMIRLHRLLLRRQTLSSYSLGPYSQRFYTLASEPSVPKGSKLPPIWRGAAIMSISGIALMIYFLHEKKKIEENISKETGAIGDIKLGGPFSLTNQFGKTFTNEDLKGKYSLFYFGFTHCPDICPDELDKITRILTILDKNKKTKDMLIPVFVTCDPLRDTPETLRTYLNDFSPKIIGLTGPLDDMTAFAKKYRVYFKANPTSGDGYLVDHSIFMFLMGKEGEFVDYYGYNLKDDEMATSIANHIKGITQPRK